MEILNSCVFVTCGYELLNACFPVDFTFTSDSLHLSMTDILTSTVPSLCRLLWLQLHTQVYTSPLNWITVLVITRHTKLSLAVIGYM